MRDTSRLVFVHIGWMKWYAGMLPEDPTRGGFKWLKGQTHGHESWNFAPYRGWAYGYIPDSRVVNIRRLGATAQEDHLSDVTVVWIAKNPATRKAVVVGWYLHAEVWRRRDVFELTRAKGVTVTTTIRANERNVTLLPEDARTLRVASGHLQKGGFGQNPIWYGGKDEHFLARVRELVTTGFSPAAEKKAAKQGRRPSDWLARQKVERAAVDHATSHYESPEGGSRTVRDVSLEKVGWDLEASVEGDTLLVEVKGLSGSGGTIELTPNEYEKMRSVEHRAHFVLYVVSGATTRAPKAIRFRFAPDLSSRRTLAWVSDSGRRMTVKPMVGARVYL